MKNKVVVIGLDCLDPHLVFEKWISELPHFQLFMQKGLWGPLKSIHPPVTVPAWMCMMTGKDPGELGIYGFRNRRTYNYDDLFVSNSTNIKYPAIWEIASQRGKKCLVIGVPLTYPAKPLNGKLCSCFLADGKDSLWTFPSTFAHEINEITEGNYIFDIRNFRNTPNELLLKNIYEMTEQRFHLFKQCYSREPWDFAMMVDMGADRMHHCFWKYFDANHRLHEHHSAYRNAIHDYYVFLDRHIGVIMNMIDKDTHLVLVSDHGCQRLEGAICINEWLIQHGWLVLKEPVSSRTLFTTQLVDWSKTTAWGEGGYYGRVFLNVQGREPQGIVPRNNYHEILHTLKEGIQSIRDDKGNHLDTIIYTPQELYKDIRNIPPDLLVYFDNLRWRSAGSVGTGSIHLFENDTGPDDANHAMHGIFAAMGPAIQKSGKAEDLSILQMKDYLFGLFCQ